MTGGGGFTRQESFAALSIPAGAAVIAAAVGSFVFVVSAFVWGPANAAVAGVFMACFGGILGVLMLTLAARPGDELSFDDRRWVVRSVFRGEAPPNPKLAAAVVAYARAFRGRSVYNRRNLWWIVPLAVVNVVLAVHDARAGRWHAAAAWIVPLVAVVANAPRERRSVERARAAQAAAEGLLGRG